MSAPRRGHHVRLVVLRGLVVAICALAVSACTDLSDLQFVQDHHLEFTAPADRAQVKPPFTLHWRTTESIADLGTAGHRATSFAVFVDRTPIRPGHTLDDVAGSDDTCKQDPHCPDRRYLADRGVYVTTHTSLRLRQIAPLDNSEKVQLHEITIVLLDRSGRRIGESAWYRDLKIENRSAVE